MKTDARSNLAALGFRPDEIAAITRVARRAGTSPRAALVGMARIALGFPFATDSIDYRLLDACNDVGSLPAGRPL